MGQSTWKSIKECIGIRAQLRIPINTQLPKRKKVGSGRSRTKDLGSLRLHIFSFFFFYFCFRRYSLDCFHLSLICFSFWISMLSFRVEAECRILFSSNYYLECSKSIQISGILLFQFQIAVILMIRGML